MAAPAPVGTARSRLTSCSDAAQPADYANGYPLAAAREHVQSAYFE